MNTNNNSTKHTTHKKIIIAEKPSVGREYAKALGITEPESDGYIENDSWIVTWSFGHLVKMSYPEKYDKSLKNWSLKPLPFLPKKYLYEIGKDVKDQFETIKSLYNRPDISAIYYAGDSGREGLYIQMLIRQEAGHNPTAKELVVWIDSQTEEEILRGIKEAKPLSEYANMKNSGYLRAIEDYASGINFSRILSLLYGPMVNKAAAETQYKPIAIGRVMTCVMGMVCAREREIKNFNPTDFYKISGTINKDGQPISAEWKANDTSAYIDSEKLYSEVGFSKEDDAKAFISSLSHNMTVYSAERVEEKKYAPLLFSLAELQSKCTKVFHISPKQTLDIAQSLYEKKLTTYPRTDARVLTSAIEKEIHKNVKGLTNGTYAKYAEYALKQDCKIPKKYVDDSKVTDHYAIIPTGVTPSGLTDLEQKIYDMIVKQFLSIFCPPAIYDKATVCLKDGREPFYVTAKYMKSAGFYSLVGKEDNDDKKELVNALCNLKEGEHLASTYEILKGKTTAPSRYTSGSMIKAMEHAGKVIEDEELREQIKTCGIGTSATRGDIIEKLVRLNYIKQNNKTQILTPAPMGDMIYEIVQMAIPSLLSPKITANWEKGLDQVANGEITANQYLKTLYSYIEKESIQMKNTANIEKVYSLIKPYAKAEFSTADANPEEFEPEPTGITCPLCNNLITTARFGYACSEYKRKDGGGCSFAIGSVAGVSLSKEDLSDLLITGKTKLLSGFRSKKGTTFDAYLVFDKVENKIKLEFPEANAERPNNTKIQKCPKCKSRMIRTAYDFHCSSNCGVKLSSYVCKKVISDEDMEKIFIKKKSGLITGLKNKEGKSFKAYINWDGVDGYTFAFPKKKFKSKQ